MPKFFRKTTAASKIDDTTMSDLDQAVSQIIATNMSNTLSNQQFNNPTTTAVSAAYNTYVTLASGSPIVRPIPPTEEMIAANEEFKKKARERMLEKMSPYFENVLQDNLDEIEKDALVSLAKKIAEIAYDSLDEWEDDDDFENGRINTNPYGSIVIGPTGAVGITGTAGTVGTTTQITSTSINTTGNVWTTV